MTALGYKNRSKYTPTYDYSKEALLKEGYNLADAEIVYGKDWLDNYVVD